MAETPPSDPDDTSLAQKLGDLQDRLDRLIDLLCADRSSSPPPDGAADAPESAQAMAERYRAAYIALTFTKDRQTEEAQRAYGSLAARFAALESKLTQRESTLRDLRVQVKSVEAANRKLLQSKRWQAGEIISRAIHTPGRATLALPIRLVRLMMRRD